MLFPYGKSRKGWLILTAALELSRNQVTHFYSRAKNTDEMIKMADLLRDQYHACRTIYLSWDAASWHVSKKLNGHLEKLNQQAGPIMKTAALPAGAQFLNVIESVFSEWPELSFTTATTRLSKLRRKRSTAISTRETSTLLNTPSGRGKRSGECSACRANFAKGKTARIRCTNDMLSNSPPLTMRVDRLKAPPSTNRSRC